MQEAFTRLARTDIADIDDPEGWLVVVTSRLCLDRLRTRRRRPTDALDVADDPFDPHALDPSIRSRSSTTSPWRCMPCSNG